MAPSLVLLLAGLALSALASGATALLAGYVALAAGAYLWARRREVRRGAPRGAGTALALAVLGEVLLLEALVDLGWLAGGAALAPMRRFAGEGAPASLVPAGYGLALGFAAAGAAVPALALAAGGLVGMAKVLGPAALPRALALAVAAAVLAAVAVRIGARRALSRAPPAPADGHGAARGGGHGAAHDGAAPAGPAAAALARWRDRADALLGSAEGSLLGATGSGALLLVLFVVLVLLVGR
jgi:hypothetical protein